MRVLALTVGRNESERYLSRFFEWTSTFVDGHFYYDDQSEDTSVDVASRYATVRVRPEDVPSFIQHEGVFRKAAFEAFVDSMDVRPGDWVFVLDCDEFFVGPFGEKGTLRALAARSVSPYSTQRLTVVEIFGTQNGKLRRRVDGFWRSITADRLFQFTSRNAEFSDKEMGGGVIPLHVQAEKNHVPEGDAAILHLGYLSDADRVAKHERYAQRLNNGHASSHIRSIVETAETLPWSGKVPCVLGDLL